MQGRREDLHCSGVCVQYGWGRTHALLAMLTPIAHNACATLVCADACMHVCAHFAIAQLLDQLTWMFHC